ncbi:sigma-54 interaction domain-containing protein [Bacilliculturomica massiliensis]|uniref:sigma-54 interaction domain-containing protein n=1 Tax=Bacilliculturomica massiliensis TaxID=1917867 RepID=UPI0010303937|nr:sigma 54-interacting transcriptional regulator [Bacilliculturomica massiliensis]
MEKPSVFILASTHDTAEHTEQQLREIFRDHAVISKGIISEQKQKVGDMTVLITNKLIEVEALTVLKPGTPYLVADRVINVDTISLLYGIPEGSDVLIMNVTQSITSETIRQIKEWGIDHITLHPYYPGIASYQKGCEYAVAFGEGYLKPDPQARLIDLGTRPLNVTTCVKLAMEIGIYEQVKDTVANSFMRPGIQLSYSYARQYKENRILTSNLRRLIDRVNRGAVMLNEDGEVLFSNEKAKKILKLRESSPGPLAQIRERIRSGDNQFFEEIEGESYYVEAASDWQGEDQRVIVTIDDVQKIKRIEDNYRKMLQADGLVAKYTFKDIIYRSPSMEKLIMKCRQFAKSHSTVAIYGESGCGKELLAQAIHNASDRKNEAFVAVNFAALSSSLCEAELFGYEEGAFTGAKKGGKKGLFELAHKGTIFLDEIGDASLDIQKKILRVIQERQVMRIGGSKLISVDIRIVAATNQDLLEMVRRKEFREDLYYRINVLPLRVPPVRDRREDIIPLFLYFLTEEFGMSMDRPPKAIADALMRHPFFGNVRELHNLAEYTANCMQSGADWIEQVLEVFLDIEKRPAERTAAGPAAPAQRTAEDLVRQIENQCALEPVIDLLKILGSPPGIWTREKIIRARTQGDWRESQVKRYLAVLKDLDLICSKTRTGTFLKQEGKELLEYVTKQGHQDEADKSVS